MVDDIQKNLIKKELIFGPDNYKPLPVVLSKAKGVWAWDVNDKKYLDMMCYVGQNTLGYNNAIIDNEAIKKIKLGNMSTLNSPEEVALANELLKDKAAIYSGNDNPSPYNFDKLVQSLEEVGFYGKAAGYREVS